MPRLTAPPYRLFERGVRGLEQAASRAFPLAAAALCVAWVGLAQLPLDEGQSALAHRFQAGHEAMRAGRFEEAESEYRAVLEEAPALAEARANLGLVLFLQGKYADAASELERVAADKPDLPAAHLFLGLAQLKLGAPAKAIPALKRSLRDAPANLEARRALAACYMAEADFAGAVGEYQAAFRYSADKVEAWYRLGRDYMDLMSELAGGLVVGQPDSAWASRLGADMLCLSDAWEAAVPYYETAIAADPALPGQHASLGLALLRLGRLGEAEEAFNAELRVDSRSEQAWLGLAGVNLERGDSATALGHLDQVWSYFPQRLLEGPGFPLARVGSERALQLISSLPRADGGPSRYLQALLFGLAGEEARASLQGSLLESEVQRAPAPAAGDRTPRQQCLLHLHGPCAEALQTKPSLSRADLLLLGRAYLALRQEDRAVIAFTHALRGAEGSLPEAAYWSVRALQSLSDRCFREVERLAPGSWRVHQLRAEAHRQRQADDEAVAEYRRAIELRPDEPELHRSLGLLHLLNNAHDDAQRSLERALGLDGANPRTLYLMGRLHVARQQHPESLQYLEAALRLDPNLVEARPSLGRAYLRVGRFDEAAAQLEQGVALDYYGDIHYSLFQAYRQLGRTVEAKAALDRSVAMRKRSFARDRSKFDRWIKSE